LALIAFSVISIWRILIPRWRIGCKRALGLWVSVLVIGGVSLAFEGVAMAVEEAPYSVVTHDGQFEVRDYPPLVAAEVTVPGDQDQAVNAGFRLLAGYIFGGNHANQRIAMTAPVEQSPATQRSQTVDVSQAAGRKIAMTAPVMQAQAAPGSWAVRFIMPAGSTLDNLPAPNDPSVHLVALPAARFAVVRFSGLAYAGDVAQQTQALRDFVASHHWQPVGPPSLARFNPPWTLWFLRRNEVMLPLQLTSAPPSQSPP
jgi:hypothetical protein